MPGIVGCCGHHSDCQNYNSMVSAITYRKDCRFFYREAPSVFTGLVSLGVVGPKDQPYISPNRNGWAFLDGEFYGVSSQDSALKEFYLAVTDEKGIFDFKGSFCGVCVNITDKKLYLISDKFGTKPVYYAHKDNFFGFSSEVKALLRLSWVDREVNKKSLGDFFHFGFVLGCKTLFNNIKLLPPATILRYDLQTKSIELKRYWELDSLFVERGRFNRDMSLEDVSESFKQAVDLRSTELSQLGISLSGGLDSRAILAALGQNGRGIYSYTLGLPGCADQKLTYQMSKIMGTKHHFLEIDSKHLKNFESIAATLITYSDGLYHPHESTEKIALDYFVNSPFRIVMRGHGGEIAKAALAYPVQTSKEVRTYKNIDQILEYILHKANLGIQDLDPKELFQKELEEIVKKSPAFSVKESLSNVNKILIPEDWCIFFYINEWIRRQVVASLAIFRTQVEIRIPFLDEDFLSMLLQLPITMRYKGELQVNVVRKFAPSLLKVSDSNTGAPLDAGKFRVWITDKWNSVMKRLSIKGYRHYTEFEKWQRTQFKDSMEQIIFEERTLDRGLYKKSGLKKVFNEHVENKKNYGRLLGTVVGLELWYRRFVD